MSIAIGDGRSTLAARDTRYDQIHIGFTNTLTAGSGQAYALSENNLYTVEAFDEYFDHLRPGGILSVSRLYRFAGDEVLRATVLALTALRDRGIADPERHVIVMLGRDTLASFYGTVLVRLEPFTVAEVVRVRRLAAQRTRGLVYAPDGPYRREWRGLAAASSPDDFCERYPLDVCAPTDNRPFFLNPVRLGDLGEPLPASSPFISRTPFVVLLVALGILLALCAVAFVVPLVLDRRPACRARCGAGGGGRDRGGRRVRAAAAAASAHRPAIRRTGGDRGGPARARGRPHGNGHADRPETTCRAASHGRRLGMGHQRRHLRAGVRGRDLRRAELGLHRGHAGRRGLLRGGRGSREARPLALVCGPMHSAVAGALAASLVAGPTVLAFFSGGYFERPRLVAGLLAWLAVIAAAVLAKRPLPREWPGRVALAGLAALCVWTALSFLWTPIAGATEDDLQRVLLYLAYFLAATVLFRAAWVTRLLEPLLAAGTLIVVGYGLSERLVPDLVDLSQSVTAGGRLEQPLTYWNAMGALAALGVVLCVRMMGDVRREPGLRVAAAAATVPLAAGVYLSLSRGVLAALAVGLTALVALAPDGRAQLRAVGIALLTSVPACLAAGALPAVRTLGDSMGARRAEGLVMLAMMVIAAGAGALLARREARSARPPGEPLQPRHRALATAGVALVLLGALLGAAALESKPESRNPAFGANPQRLQSLDSNRYSYWRVALDTFADRPVQGLGSGAFVVEWLQHRDVDDPTREPHSVYLGTLAELGLVGFACLLAFVWGMAAAARRLWRADPALTAGPIAALILWGAHAGIDWDWEMPALTMVALALAGAVVAWSELLPLGEPATASAPAGSARSPGRAPVATAAGRDAE